MGQNLCFDRQYPLIVACFKKNQNVILFKVQGFSQNCAKTLHLNNSKVYTNMLGLRYL